MNLEHNLRKGTKIEPNQKNDLKFRAMWGTKTNKNLYLP